MHSSVCEILIPELLSSLLLEIVTYYGSAFVTYRNEIESKGVQFPGQDAPDQINRGG